MRRYQREYRGETKKKIKKGKQLPKLIFLLLVVLVIGSVYFFRAESFQIKQVAVFGAVMVSEEDVKKVVRENITGSYFFSVIPKTSTFFISKKNIIKAILASSPRIKTVYISRENANGLNITLTERKVAHTWCQGTGSTTDLKECYYIDEEGFAFAQAPRFSPGVVFEFFGNDATSTPLVGTTVTGSTSVSFILSFRSSLSSTTPLSLISARAISGGDYELESLEGPVVLVSENDSPTAQSSRLNVFFRSDVFTGRGIGGEPTSLKKIDLRFGQKIFYTLKSEAKEEGKENIKLETDQQAL